MIRTDRARSARARSELVHRDHRARVHGHAAATDAEILEFLFEDSRVHDQAVAVVFVSAFGRALEHADVGQLVGPAAAFIEREGFLHAFANRALGDVIHDRRPRTTSFAGAHLLGDGLRG